ncbi:MAG: V-type ATP synthase subunit A [Thermoleophilia bacterium]
MARLIRITGSLAVARPLREASLYELVRVGERGLLGEVIRLDGDVGTIQVYEDTSGLATGEPVALTGSPLAATLGPGLLGSIVDGVGRPLSRLAQESGDFLRPGLSAPTLDPLALWHFVSAVAPGDSVEGGDVLGEVEESGGFAHRIMTPPGVGGRIAEIRGGEVPAGGPVAALEDGTELHLWHAWPVRRPRPVAGRLPSDRPFVTGQRVFDFLFPVAEGGTVAVPGGFGTGKTVIEQTLAKYAAADVVVYVGCGERGNEMAEVLSEFPGLTDPRTGFSIMDRTILVVNTSNMPVAAREASVYLGMTYAEYYRDMGYGVALMADSLSRWAEALRELSSRLQEMPGEEGYPTYLGNRMGTFYERAGRVVAAGRPERTGAVTFIGAISPPGGDFSEPVTQGALRVVGGLWALDAGLAHQRQFPAVDWEISYSLYADALAPWFIERCGPDWPELRGAVLELLQRDRELRDIAGLVGVEALQDTDRVVLDVAGLIREAVLGQSAYDPNDAISPLEKTKALAALSLSLHRTILRLLEEGAAYEGLDIEPARHALLTLRNSGPEDVEARALDVERLIAALGREG